MSLIKNLIQVITISLLLFLAIDFFVTWSFGARGFSKFFIHNSVEGRINKPKFSGRFGSILDDFSGSVSIGSYGERRSNDFNCNQVENRILFVGDSTTAGFEVDDDETFVSLFNSNCAETASTGINLGVRAHDTHAVIGTYMRVRTILNHDAVVYLMTENDFLENVDPNSYAMMSQRFGRRYEDTVLEPNGDYKFSLYADLRVFVGDRLSLTTFLLKLLEQFMRSNSNASSINIMDEEDLKVEVEKAFKLIQGLSILTAASNAELYVFPYPRLGDFGTRDRKIKLLADMINERLPGVLYLQAIDDLVDARLEADGSERIDMRYRNDPHLSEYGHRVMAEIITSVLLSNGSYND